MKTRTFSVLILFTTLWLGFTSFEVGKTSTISPVLVDDNHDLVIGIPGLTNAEIDALVQSVSNLSGVKTARFCPNMDCLIVKKAFKRPASNASVMNTISSLFPNKQTFIKDFTTIQEIDNSCNYKL
jgi:hypothetical protein